MLEEDPPPSRCGTVGAESGPVRRNRVCEAKKTFEAGSEYRMVRLWRFEGKGVRLVRIQRKEAVQGNAPNDPRQPGQPPPMAAPTPTPTTSAPTPTPPPPGGGGGCVPSMCSDDCGGRQGGRSGGWRCPRRLDRAGSRERGEGVSETLLPPPHPTAKNRRQ